MFGRIFKLKFLTLSFLILANSALAQGVEVAKLDSAEGDVEAKLAGQNDFAVVSVGQVFHVMDTVRTSKHARAGILFSSGVLLRLAPGTSLTFQNPDLSSGEQPIELSAGKGFFFSREPASFPRVDSPAVTTAVRGTEFVVEVEKKSTKVSVMNGQVECRNKFGSALLGGGEAALTELGKAPTKATLVRPQDAVQWALYYPNLLGVTATGDKNLDSKLAAVALSLARGESDAAQAQIAELQGALEKSHNAGASLRAALLAQQSLIALVHNDKKKAQELSEKALQSEGDSYAANLASAYVAQADFDLEKARSYLQKGLSISPKNPLLLTRLAELELGFGEVDAAQEHIMQALEAAPNDEYANALKGFADLIRGDIHAAKQSFESSLLKNSAQPLARLGLGLADIRLGDLAKGRKELEQAVYLDPNVSVVRSYLGKAYFEEEREHLASKEYDKAIELDPNDPTSYLYRAYNNLSQNKLVDALSDVEQSIAKNNNRAVYRSSLLLDQDLGVRSSGLAEVFTALGFDQAARIEAIKALNQDYSNYSAHRMLADSYNSIFTSDARVSEKQISNLLAPLSFNLFSSGSAQASLNEYNSLFDRDQMRTQIGGSLATQDDLIAPNISVSGKSGKFGYALSHDSTITDGSKHNNYFRLYRAEALAQYEIDDKNRLVLDTDGVYERSADGNAGNSELKFRDYDLSLGYHAQLAPNLKLIAESRYSDKHNDFFNFSNPLTAQIDALTPDGPISGADQLLVDETDREKIQAARTAAQLVFDSKYLSSVFGAQYYYSDADRRENSLVLGDELQLLDGLGYRLLSSSYNTLNSYDIYDYVTLRPEKWIDINLGASFSDLQVEDREISPYLDGSFRRAHVNPKFGLSVYPLEGLTLRAAYFEGLRKSSLEDAAELEPTFVGGFNQRFSDLTGARSRSEGIGIDYKLPSLTYFGVEEVHRHVVDRFLPAVPEISFDIDGNLQPSDVAVDDYFGDHQEQDIFRSYLYQVLSKEMVGTLDYEWSTFKRTDPDIGDKVQLHKLAPSLRYFSSDGWFAFVTATWRDQIRRNDPFVDSGSSAFWLFDAGLGFRIPKRHGSVVLKFVNLLNKDFTYDQSFGLEPVLRPDFGVRLETSINF